MLCIGLQAVQLMLVHVTMLFCHAELRAFRGRTIANEPDKVETRPQAKVLHKHTWYPRARSNITCHGAVRWAT